MRLLAIEATRTTLKRLAIGYGDDGFPPAEQLRLGSKVVGCDPEAGSITLASGEVVAADGVHSTIRKGILGETVTANATGSSFRCLFDTSALDDYPHLAWLKDGVEEPWNISAHDGKILTFFLYFIRDRKLLEFVAFYSESKESQEAKLWTRAATKKDILASVPNFHPKSRSLLDLPIATPILSWQECSKERGEFVNLQSQAQTDPKTRSWTAMSEDEIKMYLLAYDAINTAEEYYQVNFAATTKVEA